jgi:hypothetical protein
MIGFLEDVKYPVVHAALRLACGILNADSVSVAENTRSLLLVLERFFLFA